MDLALDTSQWDVGENKPAFLIEFDSEHGTLQAFGAGEVMVWRSSGRRALVSEGTGGEYHEPDVISGDEGTMEMWHAEEHCLAVFADEESMRKGAAIIVEVWGDELPVGIHRRLTS
jgi:hypothetical protein